MTGRLRSTFRLSGVALHLGYGLCIATLLYPLLPHSSRKQLQQRWSNRLLGILGVNLQVSGTTCRHGLLVANHVSWLDVFVISSIAPATFVCKSEVRHWPLIGLLCARTDTVFLERGSRTAAQRVNQTLAGKLRNGEQVAVFPEGTTSPGVSLLAFRAALLQSAIDAETDVQPLALATGTLGVMPQPPITAARRPLAIAAGDCWGAANHRQRRDSGKLATADKTRSELCEQAQALIGSCLEQRSAAYS